MKILVTGSTGLLGRALSHHLALSHEVIGLSRHAPEAVSAGSHVCCDLEHAEQTCDVMQRLQPELVIHTQALTDIDRCEREPASARAQIVETTANVIRALRGTSKTLLIHLSTDNLFDGTKAAPYDETDEPHPINVYGRCKLESERLALSDPRSVVVRTSLLFGEGRMNFCNQVLSQLRADRPVETFVDQVVSPTYTVDLAQAVGELGVVLWRSPEVPRPRLYHIANTGCCTRVVFAQRIADLMGGSRDLIQAIPMARQGRPATRPPFCALTSRYLVQIIGRSLRSWDEALQAYLGHHPWLN